MLPSPTRARRACLLPGQRLSIFWILGPERAKKLSIGMHGFAENREKSTASVQGEGSGRAGRGGEGQGKARECGFKRSNIKRKIRLGGRFARRSAGPGFRDKSKAEVVSEFRVRASLAGPPAHAPSR